MKPDDLHPEYVEFKDTWETCRDACAGQRLIHKKGERYLPKLSGQTEADYLKYLKRSNYVNATGRTVDGMRGLVFRKDPIYEVPPAMEPWIKNITMSGITLGGLARKTLEEVLKVGRFGILVDHPTQPAGLIARMTISAAQRNNQRPYIATYTAENILNWEYQTINNETVLYRVFLREKSETDGTTVIESIRELTLANGYYEQIEWKGIKGKWTIVRTITPKMNGNVISHIPFWIVTPEENNGEVCAPPIEDLAYVNISHYMNSADLENGAHIGGHPTFWINGIDDPNDPDYNELYVGSSTFLKLPRESTAGVLQCGSEGFATIEKLMDRKEQQMAALGARLIAPEKKQAEAAETANIRRGGENSVLADIVGVVETPIRKALQFMCDWAGYGFEVVFEMNTDFLPTPMDSAMLRELVGAWQSGAISELTFFEALQEGELIHESVTFEDERERKADSTPPLGMIEAEPANDNQ